MLINKPCDSVKIDSLIDSKMKITVCINFLKKIDKVNEFKNYIVEMHCLVIFVSIS